MRTYPPLQKALKLICELCNYFAYLFLDFSSIFSKKILNTIKPEFIHLGVHLGRRSRYLEGIREIRV